MKVAIVLLLCALAAVTSSTLYGLGYGLGYGYGLGGLGYGGLGYGLGYGLGFGGLRGLYGGFYGKGYCKKMFSSNNSSSILVH